MGGKKVHHYDRLVGDTIAEAVSRNLSRTNVFTQDDCNCNACLALRIRHKLEIMSVSRTEKDEQFRIAYTDSKGHRYKTLIGRFIARHLKGEGDTDKQVQEAAAQICALLWVNLAEVRELVGEDIRDFYLNGGVHSCMCYEATQNYLDLYVDNPKVVSLATIDVAGNAGRALVWNINGLKYMDHFYATSDICYQVLKEYRDRKGYFTQVELCASEVQVKMKIRNGYDSYWPFLDTMNFVTIVDQKTAMLSPCVGDERAKNEHGTLNKSKTGIFCSGCEDTVSEEHVHEGPDGYLYCASCFNESFCCCESCGEWCFIDTIKEVTVKRGITTTVGKWCPDCCHEDAFRCPECEELYEHSFGTERADGKYICLDCLEDTDSTCETEVPCSKIDSRGECSYEMGNGPSPIRSSTSLGQCQTPVPDSTIPTGCTALWRGGRMSHFSGNIQILGQIRVNTPRCKGV